MEDRGIHKPECEQQPIGMPCICDHLADQEFLELEDARLEEELGN